MNNRFSDIVALVKRDSNNNNPITSLLLEVVNPLHNHINQKEVVNMITTQNIIRVAGKRLREAKTLKDVTKVFIGTDHLLFLAYKRDHIELSDWSWAVDDLNELCSQKAFMLKHPRLQGAK